jgi:hypothetical protein
MLSTSWRARAWLTAILLSPCAGFAQTHAHPGHAASPPPCEQPNLICANSATPAFGPDGRLWLTWAAAGRVAVAHSADAGAHWSTPGLVTPDPVRIDDGPDSRPRIVVDANGRITVAFAVFKDAHWNGAVFVSRSIDGGASFASPQPIAGTVASQRFEALALDASGDVFAAWLDKRNRGKGDSYPGAALAFTWLGAQDAGVSRIAIDNTCECCRLGIGFMAPGRPVVVFRNVFPGQIRDHALVAFSDRDTPGPLRRVSEDNWQIEGCPHHGPSLAVDATGGFHVAWFSGGGVRTGLFYARSTDQGASFTAPLRIGAPDRQNARPALLATPAALYLVWKEFDGERTELRLMRSTDRGATWSAAATLSATDQDSDHPQLIGNGQQAFVTWLVRGEGLRVLRLDATS